MDYGTKITSTEGWRIKTQEYDYEVRKNTQPKMPGTAYPEERTCKECRVVIPRNAYFIVVSQMKGCRPDKMARRPGMYGLCCMSLEMELMAQLVLEELTN